MATTNRFTTNYRATIGVDFVIKKLDCDGEDVRLQLWDVAGQERFGQMTRVYYKDTIGAILVFDINRPDTFDSIVKWKQDLDEKVTLPEGSPLPCILLANKYDELKTKKGITMPTDLDSYVKLYRYLGWFMTSAKENINLDRTFMTLAKALLSAKSFFPYIEYPVEDDEQFILSQRIQQERARNMPKIKCSCNVNYFNVNK